MSLYKDIDEAKKALEALKVEYNSLTSKPAPIFNTKNLDEANAAVETMQKTVQQTKRDISDLERGFGGVYDQVKGILSELSKVGTPTKDVTKQFRTQEKILQKLKDEQQGFGKLTTKELKKLREKQNISAQNIRDRAKDLIISNKMENLNNRTLELDIKRKLEKKEISEEDAAIIRGAKEGFKVLDDTDKLIGERLDKEKQINKALGLGGNVLKGIGGALEKMGMGGLAKQLGLEEAQEKMREVAEEVTNGGKNTADFAGKTKVLKSGFNSMGKSLMKNLKDPLSIGLFLFKGIFDAMTAVDKQSGELAKNLNISYSEALGLTGELTKAANRSGNLAITTAGLGEALMAANGELGIFNTTIDDNLILFQKLHKAAGLTYAELSGVKSITDATGGDLEKNTKEIMAQARLTGQKFGVALNEKEVLKDISNVSKATTLSLGKNPGQIAKAVAAAKALGMEMSKVEGIADGLLDFESSIANELKAELLLGKDINLEKARQAALNNDIATVAEEIAKQAGSAAEFGEMNRIQQQALADAVGMSREELAKSLFVQEQIGNLTGEEYELRKQQIEKLEAKGLSQAQIKEKLGKQSLTDLKNQNSVQENLNKSVKKLKELFVSIAGPLMQIITPIVDILIPAVGALGVAFELVAVPMRIIGDGVKMLADGIKQSTDNMVVFGTAAAAFLAIQRGITASKIAQFAISKKDLVLEKAKQVQIKISGLLSSKNALKDLAVYAFNAAKSVAGIPIVGPILGAAALAAAYMGGKALLKGDDVMSPGGYGSRTLMGPEGAIALNNRDTVIAGTNLFPKESGTSTSQPVIQQDNTETKKTNQLLAALIGQNAKKPELSPVGLYEVQ
jgi:hypothetical protein